MINREENPDFLNSFLDYSITILNKSPNSVKEYNYDLSMFLKFIKVHFEMTKEKDFKLIKINDLDIDTIRKIELDDIYAFLAYLTNVHRSKATTRARKVSTIKKWTEIIKGRNNSKITAGVLNSPLLATDGISRQKVNKQKI